MENVYIADGARIEGDVTIGRDCGVFYNAVIRGDEDSIKIGERTNIQDCAVLHVDKGHPLSIGDNCTIGHGAIVHGCTIGNNVLIGMGAIVMNDAVVGDDSIIGAGALVTQNTIIPKRSIAFGNPAKVVKEMSDAAVAANLENAETYVSLARKKMNRED